MRARSETQRLATGSLGASEKFTNCCEETAEPVLFLVLGCFDFRASPLSMEKHTPSRCIKIPFFVGGMGNFCSVEKIPSQNPDPGARIRVRVFLLNISTPPPGLGQPLRSPTMGVRQGKPIGCKGTYPAQAKRDSVGPNLPLFVFFYPQGSPPPQPNPRSDFLFGSSSGEATHPASPEKGHR